jgi:hypothetical protein
VLALVLVRVLVTVPGPVLGVVTVVASVPVIVARAGDRARFSDALGCALDSFLGGRPRSPPFG